MALPPWEASGSLTFRTFLPEDASACHELLMQSTRRCEFGLIWDVERLARHLGGEGVAQTLIAEKGGKPTGFINWHVLPFLGRTEESIAVLDLVAIDGLTRTEQRQTMNAALAWMKAEGAALVLKLAIGDYPLWPLVANGFVPRFPDSYIMVTWAGEPEHLPPCSRLHLLWR